MRPSVRKIVCAFAVAGLLMWWSPHRSAADEHASHHGGESRGGMEGEHGGLTSQFFPSLMNLPKLNADQRVQIEQAAQQRMSDGANLVSRRVDLLSHPEDPASMRQGTALIREGLDQFQSGFAAQEALQQGTSPQTGAFNWFRQQLNLPIPGEEAETRALLGDTAWHLFMMVLLIAFALAMVALYFFKMRRAAALFGRLGPDTNPPPGS
jgi:hypothetical protein